MGQPDIVTDYVTALVRTFICYVQVYLNNADVSCEYVTTLCRGLCQEIPVATPQDRAKLESCLAGLGSVTASMGAIVDLGLQQLRVSAIKPRIAPWVDTFLTINHILSEVVAK